MKSFCENGVQWRNAEQRKLCLVLWIMNGVSAVLLILAVLVYYQKTHAAPPPTSEFGQVSKGRFPA